MVLRRGDGDPIAGAGADEVFARLAHPAGKLWSPGATRTRSIPSLATGAAAGEALALRSQAGCLRQCARHGP
jgi:hypothetical protein